MAKEPGGNSKEPKPILTQAEIIEKIFTPNEEGKTIAEVFAAANRTFSIDHGEWLHFPISMVRVAGTPMTDAEAGFLAHGQALYAFARGHRRFRNNEAVNSNMERIKARLRAGGVVPPATVRQLLGWFGADVADDQVIFEIHHQLRKLNLRTEPDFADQSFRGSIEFHEGSRMTDREALWLDIFHARLIQARIMRTHIHEPTYGELWNLYEEMMRETKIDEFSSTEVAAAYIANSTADFMRAGLEEEIASDLAKALPVYFRTGDYAGWDLKNTISATPSSGIDIVDEQIPITTLRLRSLDAASRPPTSVSPNDNIHKAIQLMIQKKFSQLPVMNGNTPKGVVSFKSIVARQFKFGVTLAGQVKDYMDRDVKEVRADDTFLDAIGDIVHHECVLVRDRSKICGIVTTHDLSAELRQRAEPFLLINQIENHIRNLIIATFSDHEITNFFPKIIIKEKDIRPVFSLTFYQYIEFLGRDDNWKRLRINPDKDEFIKNLKSTMDIRNKIMHFRPGEIDLKNLKELLTILEILEPNSRDK